SRTSCVVIILFSVLWVLWAVGGGGGGGGWGGGGARAPAPPTAQTPTPLNCQASKRLVSGHGIPAVARAWSSIDLYKGANAGVNEVFASQVLDREVIDLYKDTTTTTE